MPLRALFWSDSWSDAWLLIPGDFSWLFSLPLLMRIIRYVNTCYHVHCACVWPYARCGSDQLQYRWLCNHKSLSLMSRITGTNGHICEAYKCWDGTNLYCSSEIVNYIPLPIGSSAGYSPLPSWWYTLQWSSLSYWTSPRLATFQSAI